MKELRPSGKKLPGQISSTSNEFSLPSLHCADEGTSAGRRINLSADRQASRPDIPQRT
ncbi:MAG TPA: hypothetical protein PKW80_00250 [Bacteroidales bacterium]|nr:hypothetical protein [Bacteroidales bacterium]